MEGFVWFTVEHYLWLIPVGFVVGAYGTLIGAGGGFVLVPLLLLLYPEESPELITSISLAVVFFNALSGSIAYARMNRVDFKSAVIFSAATIPGAVLGALSTAYIPRHMFDQVFGLLMVAAAVYLWVQSGAEAKMKFSNPYVAAFVRTPAYWFTRELVVAEGLKYKFSYNPVTGIGISLFAGYASSLLGVGGGFIHVPALVHLLNFPVHIATATSQFILAIMSLAGTIAHIATGTFAHGVRRTIMLAIGVLLGAQLGAALSNRVRGNWIIRGLAVALAFVGVRILGMAWERWWFPETMNFQNPLALFLIITFLLHGLAFTVLGLRRHKAHYFLLTGTFSLLTAIYFIKLEGWGPRLPGTGLPLTWALRIGASICTLGYLRCLYREEGSWLWKLIHWWRHHDL